MTRHFGGTYNVWWTHGVVDSISNCHWILVLRHQSGELFGCVRQWLSPSSFPFAQWGCASLVSAFHPPSLLQRSPIHSSGQPSSNLFRLSSHVSLSLPLPRVPMSSTCHPLCDSLSLPFFLPALSISFSFQLLALLRCFSFLSPLAISLPLVLQSIGHFAVFRRSATNERFVCGSMIASQHCASV